MCVEYTLRAGARTREAKTRSLRKSRLSLGDYRKMLYRIGLDFGSYSRHGNRRLVDSVTVGVTRKTDEKTSKMVFHLIEIA